MAKQFIWLMDSQIPRPGRGPGPLEKGKVYDAKDYPPHAEWVRTKAAKYVSEPSKSKKGGK